MFGTLLQLVSLSFLSSLAFAAQNSLQHLTNFGSNPTNVGMYLYRPTGVVATPALIVAIHYCTGTAQAYFSGTQYANLADSYKSFIVLYPHAPDSGGCWDVHSPETLTHNAGGDSLGIASAVRHAIANYGVDASRVFATGTSSGAMMTNVLAGAYPDLFAAGSAFAGVPYACFAGSGMWSTACATGNYIQTAQQWGDLVRAGYSGSRPRMQIWHGTADEILSYNNHGEGIKQWTNVFGYSSTPAEVQQNSPLSGWTRNVYGPRFQAISAAGVPHNIPVQENEVLVWFGITAAAVTTSASATATTTPPPSTTQPTGDCAAKYGQCGGLNWNGASCCASGATCSVVNDWYHQCL